jgi:precorrin-6A synthase
VRTIELVGIGAGDPDHLTLQAVKAIGRADVFLLLDKGEAKDELVALRRAMIAEHGRPGHRIAVGRDPDRDRRPADYAGTIADWRSRRAEVMAGLIAEVPDGGTGAFLVWGDPTLYDSSIAILDELLARGTVDFEYSVVPGVSSVSALVARHRVPLNRVGRPVQITTGRRLAEGWPDGVDDVVVMLDSQHAFASVEPAGVEIYWGAYVGTPEELLLAGPLAQAGPEIEKVRSEARERHGWIMDTYLLRRTVTPQS